jgi:hypothetical protein
MNKKFKPGDAQGVRKGVASNLGSDARPEEFTFEHLDFLPVV